jgi:hypothetical protein
MDIGILGAGNVGAALATAWRRAGRAVAVGVRGPDDPRFDDLRARGVAICAVAEAARAPVIVIATPWAVTLDVVRSLDLAGKTVIDATNPLRFGPDGVSLLELPEGSGGQAVDAAAPGAFVFKSLNQTGAEIMADATRAALPPLMFVAGEDVARKAQVLALVADLSFDARDAGGLGNARHLESFAVLWIAQAFSGHPLGRHFAFAAAPWRGRGSPA